MDYQDRITIEPDKRGGKPCIRGLRMTVYDLLGYLTSGMSEMPRSWWTVRCWGRKTPRGARDHDE